MAKSDLLREVRYTPCFDFVSVLYGSNVDRVLGKIWRYAQMRNGVCEASIETIANDLGMGISSIQRIIPILENSKMVTDLTPKIRNHPHTYRINEDEIKRQNKKWLDGSSKRPTRASEVVQNENLVVQNELAGSSKRTTITGNRSFKMNVEDRDSIKDTIKIESKNLKF